MDNRSNDQIGPDGETVAGATGGAGGAIAGAALGSLAGPIGTIIGGLAGAVGGWWAGKSVADSAAFNPADDDYYQNHHQRTYSALDNTADRATTSRPSYNDVRPAYQLGHLAGVNPDYQSSSFDDVEPHLSNAYGSAYGGTSGQNNWNDVRQYAQDAWSRGRQVGSDRTSGMGSDRTAFDGSSMNSSSGTLGDHGRNLRDTASGLADRAADAVDDLKDRVDGNPASRPGRDSTDRPGR